MKQFYTVVLIFFTLGCVYTYGQNYDAKLIELYFANDSNPQDFIEADSGFYFTVIDPAYGRELWFSDGTVENTYLVKDIVEGDRDSGVQTLAVLGDLLFFNASPNWHIDPELWVSDGTEEGTYKLKDISVMEMFVYKDKVYFQGTSEEEGLELWMSDGTAEGTGIFKDIRTGPLGSIPSGFFEFNDQMFFVANDGNSGRELWKTDGSPEGTFLVKDIHPTQGGLYMETQFLEFEDNFYFMANDGQNGQELFKSDGTAEGTVLVKDINPNGNSLFGLRGTAAQNGIFFIANDGQSGFELWKSDGTEEGTKMVKNIHQQGGAFHGFSTSVMIALNDKVYFVADDGVNGDELWVTDGSEEGTRMFKDLAPGSSSSGIRHLKSLNGKLYFVASAFHHDFRLWTSDGTENGTYPLSEVKITQNLSSFNFELFDYEDKLYFVADSEIYGRELWESDGTFEGTKLFKDFNHRWGSMPGNFNDINGLLFFSARKVTNGKQLFVSNGTIEGTRMVKNINPSGYNAIDEESETIVMNDELFFSANDGEHGFELWKSDGTESGTVMVKDIWEGSKSSLNNDKYYPTFSVIEDKLYFMADDGVHGKELWVSDGTAQGTNMVKDIFPGGYSSAPSNIVSLNNTVYFRGQDHTGTAIWKTNGTANGTVKIKNLHDIRRIRVVNNKLLIVAETSGTSYGPHDLWSSDGTADGTFHLKSFGDGLDSSIQFLDILNDELFFVAKNPETFKKSVYKTNGTIEGTELLYEDFVDIDIIRTCGDFVYFVVEKENAYGGVELWRTNGSGENTRRVAGTAQGVYNYYESLTCFQDEMFFIDAYHNQEIWRVDKSSGEANTLSYTIDGKTPPEDLLMSSITSTTNVLYFEGSTPQSGGELYAIQNGELATLPVDEIPEESISTNIFTVKISNETCAGKSNGSLSIESVEEHPFVAQVNETTYTFTEDLLIEDLSPGDYSVCITMDTSTEFNQCFEFTVKAGGNLEGRMQSRNIPEGTVVNVNIDKGTAPFVATLDGEVIGSFNNPGFSVLAPKKGRLEISSGKTCEGKLVLEVQSPKAIVAYPNPATSYLNIVISETNLKEIPVVIYNGSGQLISSDVFTLESKVVRIDVQNYKAGMYYAVLQLETPHTIKFFKK